MDNPIKVNFLQLRDLFLILGDKEQHVIVMYEGEEVSPTSLTNSEYAEMMSKYVIDIRAIPFDDGTVGLGVTIVDAVEIIAIPHINNPTSE